MYRIFLASAVTLLATLPAAVSAETCAQREKLVTMLTAKHGESLAGRGLRDESALFEVWRSPETGSWTIIRTRADGTACIMAAGTHWLPGLEGPKGTPG